jgi:hypothetical protein
MNDPATISTIHGLLSVVAGGVLAGLIWYFGISFRGTSNKWLYGLRFTLWSAVFGAFYVGGGISQVILGLPEPRYAMTLSERLIGLLGVWISSTPVLFPIGVWIGARKNRKPSEKASVRMV